MQYKAWDHHDGIENPTLPNICMQQKCQLRIDLLTEHHEAVIWPWILKVEFEIAFHLDINSNELCMHHSKRSFQAGTITGMLSTSWT